MGSLSENIDQQDLTDMFLEILSTILCLTLVFICIVKN